MTGKTRTIKLNGQLYQTRLLTCGKPSCKTCDSAGGHTAVYLDTGARGGQRWQYVGNSLPDADPDYRYPVCDCGCGEKIERRGKRFASTACRVRWHRAQQH